MIKIKSKQKGIVIYQARDGSIELDVNIADSTLWLTQAQIATLFGTKRPAITKHLGNIFQSEELLEKRVCSKMELTSEIDA